MPVCRASDHRFPVRRHLRGLSCLAMFAVSAAGAAEGVTDAERAWIDAATPVLRAGREAGLKVAIVVQPTPNTGQSAVASAFQGGECLLVLTLRGGVDPVTAAKAQDRAGGEAGTGAEEGRAAEEGRTAEEGRRAEAGAWVAGAVSVSGAATTATRATAAATVPEQILREAVVAHELAHCVRQAGGEWHRWPAGMTPPEDGASTPPTAATTPSARLAALRGEMAATRREEGYADLAALAWVAGHHRARYAQVHAWLWSQRDDGSPDGSHHDTRAWLALARAPAVFEAAAGTTPWDRAQAPWRAGLQ